MNQQRFEDDGPYLVQFMGTISVVCPKCKQHAHVICHGYPEPNHQPARVVCQHCGYNETDNNTSWKGPVYGRIKQRCFNCRTLIEKHLTNPRYLPQTQLQCPNCETEITASITWFPERPKFAHDPFFGLPLWFVSSFRGHSLWAYNREHLTFIKRFVSAELREKPPNQNRSLSNRLPKWMLNSKNRSDILKAIDKMAKSE